MKKVIILVVLCFTTFCFAQPTAYTLTASDRNLFLNSHNAVRKAYGANPMTWDSQLESDCAAYALKCAINPLTHSTANGAYGENLSTWMGSPKPSTAFPWKTVDYHVVTGWYPEEKNWNCKTNVCDTSGGKMCGHLTQIIWAATTTVGCGIAYCTMQSGSTLWHVQNAVCRYKTAGNVIGRHPLGTNGANLCPVTPTTLGPYNPAPVAPVTPPLAPISPAPVKPPPTPVAPVKPTGPVTPVKPPTAPVTPPTAPVTAPTVSGVWWSKCISDYWPTNPTTGKQSQQLTPCAWEPWVDSGSGKTWCCPNPANEWDNSWPVYNLGAVGDKTAACPAGMAATYARAEESADNDSGLPMGAWIGIAVGIAVVIIIIIVVVIIVQKKKNDERV